MGQRIGQRMGQRMGHRRGSVVGVTGGVAVKLFYTHFVQQLRGEFCKFYGTRGPRLGSIYCT